MRLLVVEDEPDIAQFIRQGLCEAGYAVDVAYTGRAGLDYALVANYDIVLLDLLLPEIDGLHLLRELRQRSCKVPVLIITALGAIDKRVQGLDAGADDYLVKPFAFSELLARIRALLRRPPLQLGTILQIGALVMDVACHEVRCGGKLIDLSQREFMLLEYMMRHPNQVLTRTQIAEHVWNFDFQNDSNVVDVYIGYLRRKINRTGDFALIQTVRGMGYRLQADLAHG
jgi:DNA-binding response OmpR family regulator